MNKLLIETCESLRGPCHFIVKYQLKIMDGIEADNASSIRASSRSRMPNSLQDQEGVVREKLNSLKRSAGGYVATMSKVCARIDDLLADFANLVQVRNLQATLSDAFRNYRDNVARTKVLLNDSSVELHEIQGVYEAQEVRKRLYDERIEHFAIEAASYFNKQVSEELPRVDTSSPRGSVKSQSSRISKLSAASSRLREAKIAAEKAALVEKQTEQKRLRTIAMKVKLLELEMKQKQFEFQHQLELAKLDAEKEAEEARERTELADLEFKLAEREFSCLRFEENPPERHSFNRNIDIDGNFTSVSNAGPQVVYPQAVSTQLGSIAQVCSTQPFSPTTCSVSSTRVSTGHVTSSRVSVLPDTSSRGSTLPAPTSRFPGFSATSFQAPTVPVVSSRVSLLPAYSTRLADFLPMLTCASLQTSAVPVVSSRVSSLPAYPTRPTDVPPMPTCASLQASAVPVLSSRVSTLPAYPTYVPDFPPMPTPASVVPAMSASTLPSSYVPESSRASSCVPAMYPGVSLFSSQPPYNAGPIFTHAAQAYGPVHLPCHATSGHLPPSLQPMGESFLATIATTIERISADQGLPPLQVLKFDGSPERYPLFRQRFHQMVELKALDEQTKMARLLQFLEGPALRAVQRYEALPGGLTKALEVLQSRFGQPFKIVRACVDTLIKGPPIASQDKDGLQRYADMAQVMYDTLGSMNCLGEMNTDNLEKVILRLPKWLQDKFREHLKKLQRQRRIIPTFKDIVEFLNDRADLANHPFFTTSSEVKSHKRIEDRDKSHLRHLTTLTTSTSREASRLAINKDTKASNCPLCVQYHPLYRCGVFKSKPVEERRALVNRKRICFNCINSTEHTASSCKLQMRCRVPGCGRSHHTLLHLSGPSRENADHHTNNTEVTVIPTMPTVLPSDQDAPSSTCATATLAESSEIYLQIMLLKIIANDGRYTTTYGLIDSGSDVTMIDPSLVDQLGIQGEDGQLLLSTVSQRDKQENVVKVDFKIAPVDDQHSHQITVRNAWAVRDLTIPLKHVTARKKMEQWSHLCQVPFPEVERKKIGTNIQEAFIPLEVRKGSPNEPFAIRYCLGWSILGGSGSVDGRRQFNLHHASSEDVSLNRQLEEFWRIESHGTVKKAFGPMSVEDRKALKIIENTISKVDGHYQMGLLWRQEVPYLPFNRALAEGRLQALKRRFNRDPGLEEKYRSVIDDYVTKGYARQLNEEEASKRSKITWYLPHHPVLNVNKPNKVRVVFDAAAKFDGTSLNDRLYHGPDLTNNLVGVLIRFREEETAFTAEVEAMFHQVKVLPEDADALRFLWWNASSNLPPNEYQMFVHIFGATSSPCCANKALRQTADDNKGRYSPEVIKTVHRNFYVDGVLKSAPTTEKVIWLVDQLTMLLSEGGFHLTKFTSNNRQVLKALPQEERANPSINLDLSQLPISRALGLHWDAASDTLQFKVVPTNKPPTKRGILSTVSSLFDPLGFLGPFLLPVKVMLQELWRMDVQWDDPIPEPLLTQWNGWVESLPLVANIKIPRCFKSFSSTRVITDVQMHYFSDAFNKGYAAVGYLRLVDDTGKVHCAFVMGKTRNSPLKQWSIPRLELQSAVVATRLHLLIRDELDIPLQGVTFWTDSLTTLQFITNEKRRFKPFVANRVNEIHEASTPQQWRHVPTSLNPADDGSRGMTLHDLDPNCRWLSGPSFLLKPEEHWPVRRIGNIPEDDSEVQVERTVMVIDRGSSLDLLLRRYSSWPRLLTLVAWLLRFVNHVQNKGTSTERGGISLSEIRCSTKKIVQLVQRQAFAEEIDSLVEGRPVKCQSKLATLLPVLVEGTVRVGGRIRHAPIAFEAAHPMILPKDHPVSTLIVRYYHEILGHAGREHVLSFIRQHFWIIQARSLVRHVLRRCIDCRKRNEVPMTQLMADLPKERLTPYDRPFTYTGVDFFGPFYVKRGRSSEKVYGCLFTCLTSRAVHIEDVSSLESDAFIQALRRFISNRGCPKEIWSDNGTNFVGADKEIRNSIRQWNQDDLNKQLIKDGINCSLCPMFQWKFQPPTASHMNGVWERLIRSVRKTMKAILGNPDALVGLETLRTVFAEVVTILNSRPLTPSSDDPSDPEPLTPNHLLLQQENLALPPGLFVREDLYRRKQWRRAQFLADCFWKRRLREYVPALQQRQKWAREKGNLKVNDLVMLVDENSPRGRWLLGRVIKIYPGHDQRVRVGEVKTKNSTLVRPISKLVLLEEEDLFSEISWTV